MGLFRDDDHEPTPVAVDPLQAIDRASVPPRLLPVVDRAVGCAHRFRGLAWSRPAGPIQDRMFAVAHRVDAVAIAVFRTASRAAQLDAVATTLDPEGVTARYKELRRRGDVDPDLLASHKARFESVQRILNARDAIDGELEVLEAQLEAAVARGTELLVVDPVGGDRATTEADLTAIDDELATMAAALDELAVLDPSVSKAPPSPAPPTGA